MKWVALSSLGLLGVSFALRRARVSDTVVDAGLGIGLLAVFAVAWVAGRRSS